MDVSCFGGSNGQAIASVTGGSGGRYYYVWTNGVQGPDSNMVSNLPAGFYTLTVFDLINPDCMGVEVFSINQPLQLTISASVTHETSPDANDGTAVATASGGTPGYTYQWSHGASGPAVAGLAPGGYTVSVTDANGCVASKDIFIFAFQCEGSIEFSSFPDTLCTEVAGQFSVAPSPLFGESCIWDFGPEAYAGYIDFEIGPGPHLVAFRTPGNYTVTVECTCQNQEVDSKSGVVTVIGPIASASSNSPCEGATLELTGSAMGGFPPYEFFWTGPNGFSSTLPTPEIPDAGAANEGVYTLRVRDRNGCISTKTLNVKLTILLTAPTHTGPVCTGDSLQLMANLIPSGQEDPAYTVKWMGPNGFSSTETNPKLGPATIDMTGVYILELSDTESGCVRRFSDTVLVLACREGIAYEPLSENYKEEPCGCGEDVLESGPYGCYDNYIIELEKGSPWGFSPWGIESYDLNSQEQMPPPRNIQALSKAVKVTRPLIPGPPSCGCGVNAYTGNLYVQAPLFAIPSRGPDLSFALVYNSGNTAINQGFGNGWGWNYGLSWQQQGDSLLLRRGDGREDVFTYDGEAYHAPAGISDTLIETAAGQFVLKTKFGREFHFETPAHRHLTKIRDRNGNELTLSYTDTLPALITDATGRILELEYQDGLLVSVTESNSEAPRAYHLVYDGNRNLLAIKDPLGYSREYVYDINHNIIQIKDRRQVLTDIRYTDRQAVSGLRSAFGTREVDYDTLSQITTLSEMVGDSTQVTTYWFDAEGRAAQISGSCCGYDVQYGYNVRNDITSITDANGNEYLYDYDGKGNVIRETDPFGNSQSFTWESQFNQLAGWTDKNGNASSCTFDANGNLLEVSEPEDTHTSFSWNAFGEMTEMVDAEGYATSYEYDGNGYVRAVHYPIGSEYAAYDAIGNQTIAVSPNGDSIQIEYDALSRLVKITDPFGQAEAMRYDANGNRIWMRNKRGFTTTYQYDAYGRMARMEEPLNTVTTYVYDARGNLLLMRDPSGNETSYRYNTRNQRVSETNALGHSRHWSYDPNGNLTEETDFRGYTTRYSYNALNQRTSFTDALGHTTAYNYDANGNNIQTTGPGGVASTFTYDAHDRLVGKAHSFYQENRVYDKRGKLIAITDANGNTSTMEYDGNGRMVKMTDALGQIQSYSYDANGNRTSATDKLGHTSYSHYDAINRLVKEVNALGDSTLIAYDANGNRIARIDERGFTTAFEYDALDRLVSMQRPIGMESYAYDANGNRISKTDALGRVSNYEYDALNRMTKTIHPDGEENRQAYDEEGNTIATTNENGETTTFVFDALSRMVQSVNPMGEAATYAYNKVGQQVRSELPNGNVIHNVFDEEGRLAAAYDKLGTLFSRQYDAQGNLIRETDGNGNASLYQYDALHRLVVTTDAQGAGATVAYDANGNPVESIDREGHATQQSYDALNRKASTTNALGHVTAYSYDPVGNLAAITDANGNSTTYLINGNGWLAQETFADGTTKSYAYDLAGNLISRTDNAGQTTSYTYDSRNRLAARTYPDGSGDTFSYDAAGRMAAANNNYATLSFTYDDAGRLLSETLNGRTTGYEYDIPGNTRALTYPGGKTVTEQLNRRGNLVRLDEEGNALAHWYYDGGNRPLARTYANGAIAKYEYTANDWVSHLSHGNQDSMFIGFRYAFSPEGNKRHQENIRRPQRSESYLYDDIHRLTGFRRGNLASGSFTFEKDFAYDALGNRQQVVEQGVPTSYAANEMNEYTAISGQPDPAYDDNGNLIEDGTYTYQYDYENRLISVDNGQAAAYQYDALGRRIAKTTAEGTVLYFYDGARVVEERDGAGALAASYAYGLWVDDILTMERNGQRYFYHQNSLGSVVGLSDSSAQLVELYEYDAYGQASVFSPEYEPLNGSQAGNPYLFTGRRLDGETGLYYYRARYYDGEWGRFLQRDPLGYTGKYLNLYSYVENNSQNYLDPFGLSKEKINTDWGASHWLSDDDSYVRFYDFELDIDQECKFFKTQVVYKLNIKDHRDEFNDDDYLSFLQITFEINCAKGAIEIAPAIDGTALRPRHIGTSVSIAGDLNVGIQYTSKENSDSRY